MTRSEGPSGVLVVDKPEGPTSHDVVAAVRRLLRERRVGHAGTLDPFATGVLACAAGRATRLVRWLAGCDKTYEGVVAFGFATDTGDRTGRPLAPPVTPAFSDADLGRALASLTGDLLQVPPMYSAKKRDGVPLHVHARQGREIEREAVRVRVTGWEAGPLAPGGTLAFRVTVSAGTYVRALATELGAALGCPAHLAELRRVAAGPFRIVEAVPLDGLDPARAAAALVPLDRIPLPLPEARLDSAEQAAAFAHGRAARVACAAGEGAEVAVRDPHGALAGVGLAAAEGLVLPRVVLIDPA